MIGYILCALVGIGIGWYGCNRREANILTRKQIEKYREENDERNKEK